VDGSRGAYDEKRDSPKDLVKEAWGKETIWKTWG
jgi:hypothetical protein